MFFTIVFTLLLIFAFIFVMLLFTLLIRTSVDEIKESIGEDDTFFTVFGIVALGVEILCTMIVIYLGLSIIGSLIIKIISG